jgi:hypothetical protein
MSLIVYHDEKSINKYGIKKIENTLFKKLIYNEIHKKFRFTIPKDKFEKEFETKLDIQNEMIDILMVCELNKSQLESYLETYQEESSSLDEYVEYLSIITYNQVNPEKFKVKKKFDKLIESISEYWEDPSNCNFTLTDKFIERKFNNSNYVNGFDLVNKALSESDAKQFIDWNSNEINYLNDILKENSWKEMFISKYYVSTVSNLTNEDINQIYKNLPNEYMKYTFICNMLCSRANCHLILNNKEFLKISKPIFDKYKLVFKYLIGYAWITLKNEEYYIFHKMKDTDRIIFDFETVSLLPIYPFTWEDINQNPYASILIDSKILNLKSNCLSMNMMRDYEKYYGVCDSEEFSRRLNIFVNGSNKKGILEHIDWSCCAITGSVMTACGIKYNPLMDICKTSENNVILSDTDLLNYFFHYYGDSDIDLICNKKSILDFIDVVDKLVENTNKACGKTTVSNIHTGTIILSDEYILNEIDEIKKVIKTNCLIDLKWIKSNFNSQDVKNYFYDKFYLPWKAEQLVEITKLNKQENKLYKDYLNPIPKEEFRIYSLDYDVYEQKIGSNDYEKCLFQNQIYGLNEPEKDNKLMIKLSESIRFKITTPNTKTFEIFKTKDENFFSTVSKFHMGFVRAYWNGKTVLCLPSYITSMMLQLSIDYKYFASIRNPVEIINKYRSRGFGIILNNYEKINMAYYNSVKLKNTNDNEKWIQMYKVNLKSKQSIEGIFGVKKSSDDIFKPSKFLMGIPDDCFKNLNHNTLTTFDECFASLITPSLISLSKFKAINDNGKINPLSREIINMGWNLLNQQNI